MDKVLKFLSNKTVIIIIAILIVLLLIWFIVQRVKSNRLRNALKDIEVRYNAAKTVPLAFNLNRAIKISRVDPEAMKKVQQSKEDFDKAEANLKQISSSLADIEDDILVGKLRKANLELKDLDASMDLAEEQVKNLSTLLDEVLQKEVEQRSEITDLKRQFRELKTQAQENQSQLSFVWPTVQNQFTDIEKMFLHFDDLMFANEYEDANNELQNIGAQITKLDKVVNNLPELIQNARGVVPNLAEVLHKDYSTNKERGVFLKHLEVDKQVKLITSQLKEDLDKLKQGDPTDVAEHLEDYKARLTQLDDAVLKESQAFDECNRLLKDTNDLLKATNINANYISEQFEKSSERLGLNDLEDTIKAQNESLAQLKKDKEHVDEMLQSDSYPASEVLLVLQQMATKLASTSKGFDDIRLQIDGASSDESRAKEQYQKLQLTMNEIKAKIVKSKINSISEQYEEDMSKANEYLRVLDDLMKEPSLNVNLLNATLSDALDFIAGLYNQVSNLVRSVEMVEETIVTGNRYRSTYADIDYGLSRAELSFRNGDFTNALSVALNTVEKITAINYKKNTEGTAESA